MDVNLDIKKIYETLCPKCKEKLEKLVQEEISKNLAKEVLKGK